MRLMLCFLAAGLAAADVTVEQVNKAVGLELFADANLWDDDANVVRWVCMVALRVEDSIVVFWVR